MEAGDLDDAVEFQSPDCRVGFGEEEMEVEKVAHDLGVDQQRGVVQLGVSRRQRLQLLFEFGQQLVGSLGSGNGKANLLLDVHRLGKRAQVEADDRAFEPDPRGGDHLGGYGRVGGRDQYVRQGGHRFPPRGR